jgi:putative ABC transport system permease protein
MRQYPLRNLLRRPRRTVLTALAVAAAITVLIGVFGMLDSFERTVDDADAELTHTAADRIDVQLDTFEPANGPTIQAIEALPEIARVQPDLAVPAQLRRSGYEAIDAVVEIIDMANAPWSPTVRRGSAPSESTGILLSEKAARDLHVGVGDSVVLHHPRRVGTGYEMVDTEIRVAGTHRLPLRPYAFLDAAQASLFDLQGITNAAQVIPAAGVRPDDAQRALFQLEGVSAAVPVGTAGEAWDESLAQYTGVLRMAQAATLILALLIAFNSSSISVDERAREHATMFAFGVRRHTVITMGVVESTVVGVLGTLAGVLGGYVVMSWIFGSLLPRAVPDVRIDPYLSPTTGITLFALGVLVVGLAPVLNVRRVRRMDIPATLRVVE